MDINTLFSSYPPTGPFSHAMTHMTRSVHVEEIDQVHEYDFSDNANVTVIVKKDENGLEKYFKYLEIVCERIGHPIMCSSNDTECCVFYAMHLFIILC